MIFKDELSEIPVEELTQYGSQMANEVMNQITSSTSALYSTSLIDGLATDDDVCIKHINVSTEMFGKRLSLSCRIKA